MLLIAVTSTGPAFVVAAEPSWSTPAQRSMAEALAAPADQTVWFQHNCLRRRVANGVIVTTMPQPHLLSNLPFSLQLQLETYQLPRGRG